MIRDAHWRDGDFTVGPGGDLALATNLDVVRQDLVARLTSPRGSHWAFPTEGIDVRKFVNATADTITLLELRQDVELEVERDARVEKAKAAVATRDLRSGHIHVKARISRGAATAMQARAREPSALDFTIPLVLPQFGVLFLVGEGPSYFEIFTNSPAFLIDGGDYVEIVNLDPASFSESVEALDVAGDLYEVSVVILEVS
jgi:hypothetical protein